MRDKATRSRAWHRRVAPLFVGLLFFGPPPPSKVNAQESPQTPPKPVSIQMDDLFRSRGKLLSEGYNLSPVGAFGLKSYRLEEVALPQPLELGRGRLRRKHDSVLRLTITGDSFPPGVYKIWVGDNGFSDVDYHPQKLSVLIFDRAALEQMATLAVTNESQPEPRREKIFLPERLNLPAEVANSLTAPEEGYAVSVRRVAAAPELRGRPGVQIVVRRDEPFEVGNAGPVLRVGDRKFTLSQFAPRDLHTVIFTLTAEEFAALKDGEKLRLKDGGVVASERTVGRLRKEPPR